MLHDFLDANYQNPSRRMSEKAPSNTITAKLFIPFRLSLMLTCESSLRVSPLLYDPTNWPKLILVFSASTTKLDTGEVCVTEYQLRILLYPENLSSTIVKKSTYVL